MSHVMKSKLNAMCLYIIRQHNFITHAKWEKPIFCTEDSGKQTIALTLNWWNILVRYQQHANCLTKQYTLMHRPLHGCRITLLWVAIKKEYRRY